MADRDTKRGARMGWRRLTLAVAGVGVGAALAAYSWARPTPPPPLTSAQPTAATDSSSGDDYASRTVAIVGPDVAITREELGEDLIQRRGYEKLDLLINHRIIEIACRNANVEVTAAEVEARLAEDLRSLGGISTSDFVKSVLRKYGKTLYEWKEDVLRPDLMLAKLCRGQVVVTEEDIQNAYEAHYGQKAECRMIHWKVQFDRPELEKPQMARVRAEFDRAHLDEDGFHQVAKAQETAWLASAAGHVRAFGRHSMIGPDNEKLEAVAFALRPGQVSDLVQVSDGFVCVKLDKLLPAQGEIALSAVREVLQKEVLENRVQQKIRTLAADLAKGAQPKKFLPKPSSEQALRDPSFAAPFVRGCSRGQVVATIYGSTAITREELGEFLIARYGADRVDLLVNKRIIDLECQSRKVTLAPEEIDRGLADALEKQNVTLEKFLTEVLPAHHTTLAGYREDVIRPALLLAKLSKERAAVTEADLRQAFEAYYGEKIDCRMIVWPKEEKKYAMNLYAELRDSDQVFDEKASQQKSPTLAKTHGRITDDKGEARPIGRHTLGNDELEREVFSLQPGEVSKLVETPDGIVVVKCDRRIPPDNSVALAQVRDRLIKDVSRRKQEAMAPVVFAELRQQYRPRLFLRDGGRPENITDEVADDLGLPLPKHLTREEVTKGLNRSSAAPSGN